MKGQNKLANVTINTYNITTIVTSIVILIKIIMFYE